MKEFKGNTYSSGLGRLEGLRGLKNCNEMTQEKIAIALESFTKETKRGNFWNAKMVRNKCGSRMYRLSLGKNQIHTIMVVRDRRARIE